MGLGEGHGGLRRRINPMPRNYHKYISKSHIVKVPISSSIPYEIYKRLLNHRQKMSHPLDKCEFQATNIKCFGEGGSGLFHFSPISIVIGKNNSGKSTIVDMVEIAINIHKSATTRASQTRGNAQPSLDIKTEMLPNYLKGNFSASTSGGHIHGNHWEFATQFIGKKFTWRNFGADKRELINIEDNEKQPNEYHPNITNALNNSFG